MSPAAAALPDQWLARADELSPYAPAAAEAFRRAATELQEALAGCGDGVSLREAAAIGGYSLDHLQRLVASGAIENVGRKGKPRIRRGDIPVKPGHSSLRVSPATAQLSPRRRVVTSVTSRSST